MNLAERLNQTSSKAVVQEVVDFIGSDTIKFDELMQLFFGKNERIVKKAAWVMGHSVHKHPLLISTYLERMLLMLNLDLPDWVLRNIVRTIQVVELPEDLLGIAFERCYEFVAKPNSPTAIKIFSMTILYNICKREPELKNEVSEIILLQLEMKKVSKGIGNRGKKILKLLEKL
jgi:hypothetical protein